MRHFLIVDIETRRAKNPELCLEPFADKLKGRNSTGLGEARKIREKSESILAEKALLSPVTARLLSIGVLEVGYETEGLADGVLMYRWTDPKWHFICHEDEARMLIEFNSLMTPATEFVTFNGRGFDFPFLLFRYAINSISPQIPLATYPYNGRDNHTDLMLTLNECSMLSNLDSGLRYIGLKRWIEFFGIPIVKLSIGEGQIDLEKLYAEGKFEEISDYNRGDCEAVLHILKRFIGAVNIPFRVRQYGN